MCVLKLNETALYIVSAIVLRTIVKLIIIDVKPRGQNLQAMERSDSRVTRDCFHIFIAEKWENINRRRVICIIEMLNNLHSSLFGQDEHTVKCDLHYV